MPGQCEHLKAVVFDWAGTTIDHGSRAPALAFREDLRQTCDDAALQLIRAGAHYTVESVASIPTILRVIEVRAAAGELPF